MTKRFTIMLAALVAACGTPPSAQTTAAPRAGCPATQHWNGASCAARGDGAQKIAEGASALAEFRVDEALPLLESARNAGPHLHATHVQLYEQLGIAYAYRAQEQQALAAFDMLLTLEPAHLLSYTLSPKATFLFERARRAANERANPALDLDWPRQLDVAKPVPLEVEVLSDPKGYLKRATLHFRKKGEKSFEAVDLTLRRAGEYELVLELFAAGSAESSVIDTFRRAGAPTPALALPPQTRILGSGCATDVTGNLVRTLAHLDPVRGAVNLIVDADRVRMAQTSLLPTDLAFTPAVGDDPPYLIGNIAEIDGISLDRFLLEPLGMSSLTLQATGAAADEIIGVALSTAGGDFDGDGVLDIAALLSFGDVADGRTLYRIFISLGGVEYHGGRLVGLSRQSAAVNPKLIVVDDNGDGFDDIVVTSLRGTVLLRLGPVGL